MEINSNCSGSCETCKTHYVGGCLVGHGDDKYVNVSKEWIDGYNVRQGFGEFVTDITPEWQKGYMTRSREELAMLVSVKLEKIE